MQIERNIAIKSTHHQKPIVTDVFYNQNQTKKPIVIFCHGYKGYKDWGAWNLVAEHFAKEDFFFLKFNFSHNGGTLENPIDFPDLEAFGQNNYTTELNDLETVIDWIALNETYKNEIDVHNITLIGHSRGGGIVTIKASENANIKKVITWNGVSDYVGRFPKGAKLEEWKENGVMYVLNGRTKQQMPHYYQFFQDFKENKNRLNIKAAVQKLNKPQLIISGSKDTVVLPIDGENMHRWNQKSKWIVIDKMNHTLGSKHPWDEDKLPVELQKVIQLSMDFIR
ncbi:MAG: alpha/beta fold hydrolase [Flavobacteriaceae bacterium]|nr:alpha/beta fold hydrolase [Flavobacteriaceae bacterium]